MIVCICRRVSDRDIARHAPDCGDFEELQMETGVATACGACRDCAHAMFNCHVRGSSACVSHADAIGTLAVAA